MKRKYISIDGFPSLHIFTFYVKEKSFLLRKHASTGRNRKKNMPRPGKIERKNAHIQASRLGEGQSPALTKNQNNVCLSAKVLPIFSYNSEVFH